MGESKRQLQVGSLAKRAFSNVLLESGRNIYGNIMVTVTDVKMSSDLGLAKIYVSVYGTENKLAVIAQLEENHHVLRQQFAHKLRKHVRRIPDIGIFLDDMLDEMYRIDGLFEKLRANNQMGKEEE